MATDRPAARPGRGARGAVLAAWAWTIPLVVSVAFAVPYFAWPGHHLQFWTPLGLTAVVGTVVGTRLNRPSRPIAWYLLAAAELCFISGDTIYTVLNEFFGMDNPFPSIADVPYLLMYPLWAGALLAMVRSRRSSRDRASLLDALIVTVGLGLLSWLYLVIPNFRADGLGLLARLVSVAYPLGDVLVLSMLARLLAGGGLRIRAVQILAVGAVALLVSDVLYGLSQLSGSWTDGGPINLGWTVFYITYGVASLHPSSARVSEPVEVRSAQMGRGRLAILSAVSLVAPGVLLVQALDGAIEHGVTIALFSAGLYLLVLGRLAGIVANHRRSVEREQVLRATGDSLVAAQGAADILAATTDGARALAPDPSAFSVAVFLADGDGQTSDLRRVTPVEHALTDPHGDDGTRWDATRPTGYLGEGGRLSVCPLRYDSDLRGVLVARSAVPLSPDEHAALNALAGQLALALESARLAEDLRRQRNQAQFRALIQNASDVILVVDAHEIVTYATPSLGRALDRDVTDICGRPLAEFVHPDDAALLGAAIAGVRTPGGADASCDVRLRGGADTFRSFEALVSDQSGDESVAGVVLTLRDVSERRALEEELKHQAFHDGLTGVANRARFQDRAENALRRAARSGGMLAMVMLDVDDFKIVNDTRGHGAGDDLLVEVSRRLSARLRPGDLLARFGGDEFAVLFEPVADEAEAEVLAGQLVSALVRPFVLNGEPVAVSASAGLVLGGGGLVLDLAELLRCADLALYDAKERGKNQVARYRDDLQARMLDRLNRRADLQRAVAAGEFRLFYQPIVALESGSVVGAEALVRWQHPERGLVGPMEFIDLAESTGLIVDLGRFVLDTACAQASAWAQAGHPIRVAVNVSALQLEQDGFVEEVRAALARHALAPEFLTLELTESVLVPDGADVPGQLRALKALGVTIAVDDFGTGYSSLGYLRHFPIDTLKVDKSFVDGLGLDTETDGVVARAIVSLAHALGLGIVAEGIENVAQRAELSALGCQRGQGYLFAKPLPPAELTDLLRSGGQLPRSAELPHPRSVPAAAAPVVGPAQH